MPEFDNQLGENSGSQSDILADCIAAEHLPAQLSDDTVGRPVLPLFRADYSSYNLYRSRPATGLY